MTTRKTNIFGKQHSRTRRKNYGKKTNKTNNMLLRSSMILSGDCCPGIPSFLSTLSFRTTSSSLSSCASTSPRTTTTPPNMGFCFSSNRHAAMANTCCGVKRLATFRIPSTSDTILPQLIIASGSVVDFTYPERGAIVNAANEQCLGGGGVDGAITTAGGSLLQQDRQALPIVAGGNIRCPTGEAKLTSCPPNKSYGTLGVQHVIHAVGPCYPEYPSFEVPDALLRDAYQASIQCAMKARLETICFSLLSAGVYRGKRSRQDVLRIGVKSICDTWEETEQSPPSLKNVFMCAFSQAEVDTLLDIATNVLQLEELDNTSELN